MLEWMNKKLSKTLADSRQNVFEAMRHVTIVPRFENIAGFIRSTARQPIVVLASSESLNGGAAQKLIFEWASNPRNLVLFTARAAEDSLARKTLEAVSAAAASRVAPKSIPVQVVARRALTKKELDARGAAKATEEAVDAAREAKGGVSAEASAAAAAAAAAPSTAGRGKKRRLAETASSDAVGVKTEPVTKRARGGGAAEVRPTLKTAAATVATVAKKKKKKKKVLMFADTEPATREWDAFGLFLTQADFPWLVTGIAGAEDAAARLAPFDLARLQAARTEAERAELLDNAAMSAAGVAIEDTKLEVKMAQLDIRCQVGFVDLEGLSDRFATHMILEHMQPRQMIVVHGSAAATTALAQWAQQHADFALAPGSVFAPSSCGARIAISAASISLTLGITPVMAHCTTLDVGRWKVTRVRGRLVRELSEAEAEAGDDDESATPRSSRKGAGAGASESAQQAGFVLPLLDATTAEESASGVSSFMYRYILRESCSQFDSLPLTSLTIFLQDEESASGSDAPAASAASDGESAECSLVWMREQPLRREQLRESLAATMPSASAPRLDAGVLKCGENVFVMIDPQKAVGSSARLPAHLRGCIENQQGAGADRAVLFEGALSDDYFTARQCLYDEYRIV
jgi:hypothetical protein